MGAGSHSQELSRYAGQVSTSTISELPPESVANFNQLLRPERVRHASRPCVVCDARTEELDH
eukprot:11177420-Lingulodinium_polyedra.AAC.1